MNGLRMPKLVSDSCRGERHAILDACMVVFWSRDGIFRMVKLGVCVTRVGKCGNGSKSGCCEASILKPEAQVWLDALLVLLSFPSVV